MPVDCWSGRALCRYGELPSVRESDIKSTYSVEQSWALAVSAHDIKVGNYFFSVKCGPEPVSYRILIELTHALVEDGELAMGLVCPDEWVYHYAKIGNVSSHETFSSASAYFSVLKFTFLFRVQCMLIGTPCS